MILEIMFITLSMPANNYENQMLDNDLEETIEPMERHNKKNVHNVKQCHFYSQY